jgi:thiol:disulfide interchange protein
MKRLAILSSLLAALGLVGCEVGVEPAAEQVPQAAASAESAAPHIARGQLKFVEGYREGYAQSARQAKPMLLFFTASWCKFCHQMADEAFTHPQVVRLSDQFVCVLIDADAEPEVCQQFGVSGYPTIQFLSPRGVPLERVVGKKPGHQLMMAMQAALQHVARRTAPAAH